MNEIKVALGASITACLLSSILWVIMPATFFVLSVELGYFGILASASVILASMRYGSLALKVKHPLLVRTIRWLESPLDTNLSRMSPYGETFGEFAKVGLYISLAALVFAYALA
ncbi:MAG: hypothetical protein CMF13_02230 [Idiomarina sp.]|nr:hypothetical protein [Idiomarina sp.]|tara:strand:- start:181 stop:522 length:342 start_codon:yes stop_codon:yes gene_type:complete